MIQPIQTHFDGYHFRSRTEARFAVLWRILKWQYEFEVQGFALRYGAFLPDFFLKDRAFFEVKGSEPNIYNLGLCICLAHESGLPVFLSVGQPAFDAPVYRFLPDQDYTVSILPTELARLGASETEVCIAIQEARSARFEFGETPLIAAE